MTTPKRIRKPETETQKEKRRERAQRRVFTPEQRAAARLCAARWRAAHPEEARARDAAQRLAHREERRASAAAYTAAHPEKKRAYCAAYYAAHGEEERAKRAAYRAAHPEASRARNAAWRAANGEKKRAYMAAYYAAHPEEYLARNRRRRALKAGAPINDFTAAQWRELQASCDHRCSYCGTRAKGHLTQDHLTPLANGGSHTLANILPACGTCNSRKGPRKGLAPVQPLLLTLAPSKKKKE